MPPRLRDRFARNQPLKRQKRGQCEGLDPASSGHSFVTISLYIRAMVKDSPYTVSSRVVAAIATAYLLFVLLMLVLFSS